MGEVDLTWAFDLVAPIYCTDWSNGVRNIAEARLALTRLKLADRLRLSLLLPHLGIAPGDFTQLLVDLTDGLELPGTKALRYVAHTVYDVAFVELVSLWGEDFLVLDESKCGFIRKDDPDRGRVFSTDLATGWTAFMSARNLHRRIDLIARDLVPHGAGPL